MMANNCSEVNFYIFVFVTSLRRREIDKIASENELLLTNEYSVVSPSKI